MVITTKTQLKAKERSRQNRRKNTTEEEHKLDDGKNFTLMGIIKKSKKKEFDEKYRR